MRAWIMAYDLRTFAMMPVILLLESASKEEVEPRSRAPEVAALESAWDKVLCSVGCLDGTSIGGKLVPKMILSQVSNHI